MSCDALEHPGLCFKMEPSASDCIAIALRWLFANFSESATLVILPLWYIFSVANNSTATGGWPRRLSRGKISVR
jgi:hypothetical protein